MSQNIAVNGKGEGRNIIRVFCGAGESRKMKNIWRKGYLQPSAKPTPNINGRGRGDRNAVAGKNIASIEFVIQHKRSQAQGSDTELKEKLVPPRTEKTQNL